MSALEVGKLLLAAAVVLALVGGVLLLVGRLGIHGLPGDISVKSGGASFVFPVLTCLVISVVLTLIINVLLSLRR